LHVAKCSEKHLCISQRYSSADMQIKTKTVSSFILETVYLNA